MLEKLLGFGDGHDVGKITYSEWVLRSPWPRIVLLLLVRTGIEETRAQQREMRQAIEAGQDPEELARQLGADWLARAGFEFVTEEILFHINRAMIATALKEPLD